MSATAEPAGRAEVTDVLIVGAGPTGLTAALRLAELGVPHLVIDAAEGPSQTSKAALVHASTLEVLAELGVGDQLVEAGRKLHRIVVVDRSKVLARIELTGIPSRYPLALPCRRARRRKCSCRGSPVWTDRCGARIASMRCERREMGTSSPARWRPCAEPSQWRSEPDT
jgi:choline dehydrogenase-like flavoprotein